MYTPSMIWDLRYPPPHQHPVLTPRGGHHNTYGCHSEGLENRQKYLKRGNCVLGTIAVVANFQTGSVQGALGNCMFSLAVYSYEQCSTVKPQIEMLGLDTQLYPAHHTARLLLGAYKPKPMTSNIVTPSASTNYPSYVGSVFYHQSKS